MLNIKYSVTDTYMKIWSQVKLKAQSLNFGYNIREKRISVRNKIYFHWSPHVLHPVDLDILLCCFVFILIKI